ncbi:hypothetical protein VTN31DRAFT_286 [Thermomyces dupontii]|uniref:uncharacterized protein n=1 Tax=Talaromyces thermophilus TaxID=28565 RepID=UPI0037443405
MPSSILYQNAQRTVFLVDIPSSIANAQHLPTSPCPGTQRRLISSPPLEQPFPSPPEPKRDKARENVLKMIPESQRQLHESIRLIIERGLQEIRDSLSVGSRWCLPRECTSTIHDDVGKGAEENEAPRSNKTRNQGKVQTTIFCLSPRPPVILSPTDTNRFSSLADLHGTEVRNPSPNSVSIRVAADSQTFTIPPASSFVLGTLSTPTASANTPPIPGLPPDRKYSLIILDPPWPNRSARRAAQYKTHAEKGNSLNGLVALLRDIIHTHLDTTSLANPPRVAIWTTNSAKSCQAAHKVFQDTGIVPVEEWIWLKTTVSGEPVTPLDGLWRKPYEILIIGQAAATATSGMVGAESSSTRVNRRLLVAVPDVHSRKPNLGELVKAVGFFSSGDPGTGQKYAALEVFARNLTAGWTACGDDVLRFNSDRWWIL